MNVWNHAHHTPNIILTSIIKYHTHTHTHTRTHTHTHIHTHTHTHTHTNHFKEQTDVNFWNHAHPNP